MPINPEAVGSTGAPFRHAWDHKDVILYALGVGHSPVGTADDETFVPSLLRLSSVSDGMCARTREGAAISPQPDETMGLHCITGVADRRGFWQLFRAGSDR